MRSRYTNDAATRGGTLLQSATAVMRIRSAMKQGSLTVRIVVLGQDERLDTIAGRYYGDGRLWWVIAAASNIGWAMQVPAGTRIVVPAELSQIDGIV